MERRMDNQRDEFYDASVETMPVETRQRYLSESLTHIIQHAYQNAPAIREKMDGAGVNPSEIRTIRDLEKIPITKKENLAELQKINPPFGGFLGVPVDKLERIFISPGPIYEPHDPPEAIRITAKALYAAGFRKGDRVIVSWSFHMVPPGLRVDEALRLLGAVVIPTGVGNTELQVQIMHDLKATCYTGTCNFLMMLIKRAEELGYNFRRDFSLKHAFIGGEPLTSSLRRNLELDYGIDVAELYGTAESGTLAYQCSQKSGLHIPEELVLEIVDPQTGKQLGPGEVGEVVVTLFNEVFPLVRLGTGDLSSYTDEPCPCGRTSSRLLGIVGRVGEEVKVRGMFIHPKQVEEVMAKFDEISSFEVVVSQEKRRDELTINLELKDEAADRKKLGDSLAKTFPEVCRLKVDKINFVDKGTIPKERKIIRDIRTWE